MARTLAHNDIHIILVVVNRGVDQARYFILIPSARHGIDNDNYVLALLHYPQSYKLFVDYFFDDSEI